MIINFLYFIYIYRGTELGGLLTSIYGAPKSQTQIKYPKLTSSKKFEPENAPEFKSSGKVEREVILFFFSIVFVAFFSICRSYYCV